MIGRRIERIKAVIFILNLRPIGHHEAKLAKAFDYVFGHLGQWMQPTQSTTATRRGEIGCDWWCGCRQLDAFPRLDQCLLQFPLGLIDGFTRQRSILIGQGAKLFHEPRELSVRPNPGALRTIQSRLISGR